MTNSNEKIGLIVGRFQPFHKGHLHLIRAALKRVDRLTIAIGSSNVTNEDNPINFQERKKMLEKVIIHENLQDKVAKVISSPDVPDDNKWVEELLQNAGHLDIVFGNNPWTNNCLQNAGYKIIQIPYFEREINQGKIIREKIRTDKDWQSRVPNYLQKDISRMIK